MLITLANCNMSKGGFFHTKTDTWILTGRKGGSLGIIILYTKNLIGILEHVRIYFSLT